METTWITVKDAAQRAGFGVEYIRELVRDNKIVGQKFGWQWMVSKESLDQYLQSRKDQERQT
jgi:excisionase family DNA binding protein